MLSAKKVASAIKQGNRSRLADGHNLYLQVRASSNASWVIRFERGGRERWFGLGPAHTVSLGEARIRARRARLMLLDGLDPIEERAKQRASAVLNAARAMTFATAAREYFSAHSSKWRSVKTAKAFVHNVEAFANPVIGALPVAAIDVGLVLKVLEPHWATKTVTMSRLRGQIEQILDWAKVRGLRTGDNPARWRGHLDKLLARRIAPEHHPALPYGETAQFVSKLRSCPGIASRALEFLILTAARSGEVIAAVWDEIDLTNGVWTIPKERMKGHREHRVPLSARAVELLRELPRKDNYVFSGAAASGGLSALAMRSAMRGLGYTFTIHGFRSSFRDWAAETTAYPNHVVEMALAHTVLNAVEAAYRRGDLFEKRRRLMAEWAQYCDRPSTTSEVIPLRTAVS